MGFARRLHAGGGARCAAWPRHAYRRLCLSDIDPSGRRPRRRSDDERPLQQLSVDRRADVHLRRQHHECKRRDRAADGVRGGHGGPSARRLGAGQRGHQSDLFGHERQRGRRCVGPRSGAGPHDGEAGPLSARFCGGDIGRLGDAWPADANLYPDDLLRADRQCVGRRHVSWRARSGGLDGALADDRHRRHRAPPRFSARKADDLVADAGGARPRAAGDCAAGNSARTDLFRYHHADRGGGHRCDLCLVAGADRLSHAEPVATTGSHIRHGAGDGDDRTHHVRSVRF